MIRIFPFLSLLLLLAVPPALAQQSGGKTVEFVGSKVCAGCHSDEFAEWQTSHHAKSMMLPDAQTVLGDFGNKSVDFGGVETIFSRQGDGFFITTQNGAKQSQTYKVIHTFGYEPLQQYLLDIGGGKLQAFDIAWDSRPADGGGQRWFKLLPDEDTGPDSPFHWTRQLQNWNSRCSDCHSTNVSKGYAADTQTYKTQFSEINVACESCHGAGKKHVDLVNAKAHKDVSGSGFAATLEQTRLFRFSESAPIAVGSGKHTAAQINACGGCHSRRQTIGIPNPATDYHDQYRLSLLDPGLYHADGQIQDEVFVLGSFMQSKMYQAGVTCTDCHNPHTGAVKAEDNGLCTQCHQTERYDSDSHHRHEKSSAGAQCVSCHMPATTYMQVDDRRDHSFSIPYPQQSAALETPNACIRCHDTRNSDWAAAALQQWPVTRQDKYGAVIAKGRAGDPRNLRALVAAAQDPEMPPIKQATLMTLAANVPSRVSAEALVKQLKSDSPLVRSAAVEASRFIPPAQRWTLLKGLIRDPSARVRFEVARQLAAHARNLQGIDKAELDLLLSQYHQQLQLSEDMPSGQAQIATYKLNTGDITGAVNALKKALKLEPDFIPALLNLADLYRGINDKAQARKTLEKAMKAAPDSADVQHSYGLYWVRQGNTGKAIHYLKAATELDNSSVRYAYVYSVAQESLGQIEGAIETLKQTNQTWPNQYDILLTLVLYLEKSGREKESYPYLSRLSAIAPNDPEVKRRIKRLQ